MRLHTALLLPLKEQQAPVQNELPHFILGSEVQVPEQASSGTLSLHAAALQQEPSSRLPVRFSLCRNTADSTTAAVSVVKC